MGAIYENVRCRYPEYQNMTFQVGRPYNLPYCYECAYFFTKDKIRMYEALTFFCSYGNDLPSVFCGHTVCTSLVTLMHVSSSCTAVLIGHNTRHTNLHNSTIFKLSKQHYFYSNAYFRKFNKSVIILLFCFIEQKFSHSHQIFDAIIYPCQHDLFVPNYPHRVLLHVLPARPFPTQHLPVTCYCSKHWQLFFWHIRLVDHYCMDREGGGEVKTAQTAVVL